MKIKMNEDLRGFFERAFNNCNDEVVNSYIGLEISPETEAAVQASMAANNFFGFEDHDNYPSLYIDVDEYKKTPYNSHISLENIASDEYSYDYQTMPADILYNVSDILSDPNRELHDTMILKAFNKPYKTTILSQNGEFWMTDTPAEANTINPYAARARGKTITFGLGIGYFVYMALLNEAVESVTVIERSAAVIEMFNKYLRPQFPDKQIRIIKGDAFDYFNKDFLSDYDYIFVDINKSNDDGFLINEKLLEQYLPDADKLDFWIENSCFNFIRAIMLSYFYDLATAQQNTYDDEIYNRIYFKVKHHFESLNLTVEDPETLKDYLYDKSLIRIIISKRD